MYFCAVLPVYCRIVSLSTSRTMKIVWGALVTEGRGKAGGTVASRNKAGNFFRNRVTPTNPQTASQTENRATFSDLASQWRGLTNEQRTAWNAAAPDFPYQDALGQTKVYSGFQLFMKLNQSLLSAGVPTTLTSPPSKSELPTLTIVSAVFDLTNPTTVSDASITFSATSLPHGWRLQVSATPGLSQGVMSAPKSQLRVISSPTAIVTGVLDVETAYLAKYGIPDEDTKVFFYVEAVNSTTGVRFIVGTVSTIVTTP